MSRSGTFVARVVPKMSAPRFWNLVLHVHDDGSYTVRVWVDGHLLRPDCVACDAAAALHYVREALLDVRHQDTIEVRAQGALGADFCRPADAESAQRWLRAKMPAPRADSGCADGAKSGTRRIVRPGAAVTSEGAAPEQAAKTPQSA